MNRFFSIALCSLAFVFFLVPAQAHAAEIIHSFVSDIAVLPDSSLHITETVTYDFGKTERHGIFRFIPTTHPEPATAWYKDRYTDIQVENVTRDGFSEPYVVTDEQGRTNIKVGNADQTISGSHVYTIIYDVRGGLSYPYQLPPEVYWNVNGGGWDVPLEKVVATIHGSPGLFGKNRSCYKGNAGEGATCTMHATEDGAVFEAVGLAPGAQMTIAQDLVDSAVPKVVLERFGTATGLIALVGASIMGLIGLAIFIYRYQTQFKINAPIIPQYEPYPGILPMFTGVLIDGKLDPKDISAAIVYLAEKGYIKIRKTEKKVLFLFEVDDYEITKIAVLPSNQPEHASEILRLLFRDMSVGKMVSLSNLKQDFAKQSENANALSRLKIVVIHELTTLGFYQNSVFWKRLTTKGYEARNHLLGFKLFLTVTDEARFAFHNAPAKSPEQFMEYLPYAIALGVEKEWAKVFENITIPIPDWYEGGSVSAFSPVAFTTSLGAFSGALATAGGSIGASGGGGSAGGGGGGGGGGSW